MGGVDNDSRSNSLSRNYHRDPIGCVANVELTAFSEAVVRYAGDNKMFCTMGKGTMMLIMTIVITTNMVMIGMMIMTKRTMYMMMKYHPPSLIHQQ